MHHFLRRWPKDRRKKRDARRKHQRWLRQAEERAEPISALEFARLLCRPEAYTWSPHYVAVRDKVYFAEFPPSARQIFEVEDFEVGLIEPISWWARFKKRFL